MGFAAARTPVRAGREQTTPAAGFQASLRLLVITTYFAQFGE